VPRRSGSGIGNSGNNVPLLHEAMFTIAVTPV
jgi:hypothetical protein